MTGLAGELLVAVDLSGAGDHPSAWRVVDVPDWARPEGIADGSLHVAAARLADAAGVSLITIGGTFEAPADDRTTVSVELDALGLAARIAPDTWRAGIAPVVTTTHTEPFHVQASVATLDWVSHGRAGWVVDVSATREAASVVGRRPVAPTAALWAEAADVVAVSRKLWDSWEDDAIIRDVETGRFVDRDRLHYVDHVGATFSVKGPSIVPRPPQGHPVVVVRLTSREALAVAALADVVVVPATDDLRAAFAEVREVVTLAGRDPDAVRILVSAGVVLAADDEDTHARLAELSALHGSEVPVDVAGTPAELYDRVDAWRALGADGVHLRPAVVGIDLPALLGALPSLTTGPYAAEQRFASTLRERLGLVRPASQYASII